MSNEFYFHTDQMTVGYDGKPLIKDIRIAVKKGEILTLVGPNGAGKSTILKSITSQLKLIGGTIFLDGNDIRQMSRKEIAMQQAVVLTQRVKPEMMTCADVVGTGRYPYTGTLGILGEDDHKKVQEALTMVHASELSGRDFNAISDGQRQRVLLARAICQEPQIIILDEPTSFLDIRHKLEFLGILRHMVKEQNVAVIMSLHELDLAQKISDIVMCVHGPSIERYGTPEEIFTEDYIPRLYSMDQGSYVSAFGCAELPPSTGMPEVFVIAGGGSGIPVFRRLQRKGIPFATGILSENDIDYEGARHLANIIVSEKAFEPIADETIHKAEDIMRSCSRVFCSVPSFGTYNQANDHLLSVAKKMGIYHESI